MVKVLLTGGSGFLAGHVIDVLLKRGHSIVTTVRSEAKADKIRVTFPGLTKEDLDFFVVPDVAATGAFQGLADYGLDALIHVASPFHYKITDAKKDLIDPAVLGTSGVLAAIKASCPTVKRVVVTSSFAAILNPGLMQSTEPKTYSEADWSPLTLEDAYHDPGSAYIVSKTFAEKAAWEFVEKEKPTFTLSTINPPMIYGPLKYPLESLQSINTSNQLMVDIITGQYKNGLPPTMMPLWVDVRDVALAHVKAMELDKAGSGRFLLAGGYYTNADFARIVYDNFPDLREKLPKDLTANVNLAPFGYDTTRATKILGMDWTPIEKTVVDSVKSLLPYIS
ncbi:ketoreductase [Dactylonectria estremocensis]|uniref:Ketoreductase n=1 Tax=Dactylonectria estremocensis TaxID=1079267 RepID=A0A9P9F0F1_9HYPO|nr:ketoreductase [Dactylonectria estremocensis]